MPNPQRIFAYGSNMHLPDLRRWLREHDHPTDGLSGAEAARLPDYHLVWNYRSLARDGAAANVEPSTGAEVFGIALSVDGPTLAAIDAKEGHPRRYCRGEAQVTVELWPGRRAVPAWLYVVTPEFLRADPVAPRRAYLDLMVKGAATHGLDPDYVEALRRVPTCD